MCNVCCAEAGMKGIAHYDWEADPEARKARRGLMNNNDSGARTKKVLVQIETAGAEFEPGRGRFRREDERDWSPWFDFHDAASFCGWLCLDVRAAFVKRAIWRWITGKQGRANVEALIRRKIERRKACSDVDVWPRLKRAEGEISGVPVRKKHHRPSSLGGDIGSLPTRHMTGLPGDGQYRLFRKMRGADLRREEQGEREANKRWRRWLKQYLRSRAGCGE